MNELKTTLGDVRNALALLGGGEVMSPLPDATPVTVGGNLDADGTLYVWIEPRA